VIPSSPAGGGRTAGRRWKRRRCPEDAGWTFDVLRVAHKAGFTAEDLEHAARVTGRWPGVDQIKAADDRDVVMALIEARRRRLAGA
jgi:hypothetical protein